MHELAHLKRWDNLVNLLQRWPSRSFSSTRRRGGYPLGLGPAGAGALLRSAGGGAHREAVCLRGDADGVGGVARRAARRRDGRPPGDDTDPSDSDREALDATDDDRGDGLDRGGRRGAGPGDRRDAEDRAAGLRGLPEPLLVGPTTPMPTTALMPAAVVAGDEPACQRVRAPARIRAARGSYDRGRARSRPTARRRLPQPPVPRAPREPATPATAGVRPPRADRAMRASRPVPARRAARVRFRGVVRRNRASST